MSFQKFNFENKMLINHEFVSHISNMLYPFPSV